MLQTEDQSFVKEIVASYSHDAKNLLTMLYSHIELALMYSSSEAKDGALIIAKHNAALLCGLIDKMMRFAFCGQSSDGETDVSELLRDAVTLFPRRSNIEIEYVKQEQKIIARIDYFQLIRVLFNLMINARDAMPEGGKIRIESRLCKTWNTQGNRNSWIIIEVSDTGTGVNSLDVHSIFLPGYTTKPEGNGMGLTICNDIIEAVGGSLQVHNNPSGGATFIVFLPAC